MKPRQLADTTALLCGGSAGLGLAAARALLAAGVPRLMLAGRTAERGNAAVAMLRAQAPEADVRFHAADLTTAHGAESAVRASMNAFRGVDLLLNTAGGSNGFPELCHRIPIEEVAPMVDGLIHGSLLPSRAVLPIMMAQESGGVILNIASDAGKIATPGESVIGAGMVSHTLSAHRSPSRN